MDLNCPILAVTPLHRPDGRLAVALMKAGVWAVIDVGNEREGALEALAQAGANVRKAAAGRLGVKIHRKGFLQPEELPDEVRLVVLPGGANPEPWRGREGRQVFAQVTTSDEAMEAQTAGFDAVVAVGNESGGRVSPESAFVLLQRLMQFIEVPVWVQGGIGLHTAAACFAGGASGVVIDSQLALVKESTLGAEIRRVIRAMDGTETTVIAGRRVFSRPDLPLLETVRVADAAKIDSLLGVQDVRSQLLPLGQDAALASLFAERFVTAGGVVHAIQSSTRRHLIQAREKDVLGRGSALALEHKTLFPVVQGPMTRVSDNVAFAEAVADGGGLPFLALALMRGDAVLQLLQEAAGRMRDRSWGVGILGFVPPELRAEQLEAIQKVAPPFVIIAGGRPSQARQLEEEGSIVYLHVPSPELLRLFLKEGARRFIFEGRECGGHVGPRTSFALWESQIETLLAFDNPRELSVLFAGGIHDDRSGAMVSAMAAPLEAMGAKVGVLLGTAYLFTKEIVASRALRSEYQKMACECDKTVLLETAPGHSTRCIENEYVAAFETEKRRLTEERETSAEVWVELEKLNLGRLRLAAKGLRRDQDTLVEVNSSELRREGMFMVGGVAALRDSVTTVGELHRQVCEGAAEHLARIELEPEARAAPQPADVAIIGMACLFPKAPDLETFWANIVYGVDAVTEVPPERWNSEIYYDPKGKPGLTTPSKWGGFLDEVPFDPAANGIPPNSMAAIEPVQLLSLYVARKALADAGYEARDFDRSRTSVIFGAESGSELTAGHGFRALFQQYAGTLPDELDAVLPLPTEDTFPGLLANVIAGRISNRLDLGGKNFTVDAACASSLAAIDVAIQTLVSGSSDMVVVGGADTHNSINDYLMFSSVHALSASGRCRSFDHKADGIVLGEGFGVVVLKRLADAERDGDRIYAILRGLGGSSDGKSLGLTAPRKEGQMRAIERAYDQSGVDPTQVGLVEAHGTGTVVGDRTELESMSAVFARAKAGTCALGSVKSQIGHTKSAAGMASLIKSALCLYHRVLPPTLHIDEPNPGWDGAESPFYFTDRALPWVGKGRRIAGVSAFGFGGTNFHAVLEEPPELEPERANSLDVWPSELFLFRGNERADALRRIDALSTLAEGGSTWSLRDLARSTSTGGHGPVHVAVVARDRDELVSRLTSARRFEEDLQGVFVRANQPLDGKLAFLFPGQGSQRLHMLGDLFVAFPMLGELLGLGARWADRIWPPRAYNKRDAEQQRAALTDTRTAQPALGLVELAMFRVVQQLSLAPQMMAGHSYGELAALSAAGRLAPADLMRLSEARAEAMLQASKDDPGTMAAVSASAADVASEIEHLSGVSLANHNAPRQVVISGRTASMEEAVRHLRAKGFTVTPLRVACAFHSEVVAPARTIFADALEDMTLAPSEVTVYANATARPYPEGEPSKVRQLLSDQIASPVLFKEQIEAMYEAGARIFVEVGPGAVLSNLTREILDGRPKLIVNTDAEGQPGLRQLQMALARLAVHDVSFDVETLYQGRKAERFDIESPPRNELSPLSWLVNGHRARPAEGPLPANAMKPVLSPPVELVPRNSMGMALKGDAREIAIIDYLRNLREIVEAQRQVMLSYLGNPVPTSAQTIAVPPPTELVVDVTAEPAEGNLPAVVPAKGVSETLLAIVSERTGYPVQMLELTLDLEADLGIDSIKRVEILGSLNETLGILPSANDGSAEAALEELVNIKTLQGIIDWTKRLPSGSEETSERAGSSRSDIQGSAMPTDHEAPTLRRYALRTEVTSSPETRVAELENRVFGIVEDDRQVGRGLVDLLASHGAEVRLVDTSDGLERIDHLIHLTQLSPNPDPARVKEFFKIVKRAVASGSSHVLAATAMGGDFGMTSNGSEATPQGGFSGVLKSLAQERPDIRVRTVDFTPNESPSQIAENLLAEIAAVDDHLEVGYRNGTRQVVKLMPEDVESAPLSEAMLGRDSVVLVTGGARGITARVTRSLAERFGCTLELVGRSARPPEAVDSEIEATSDLVALKRLLIARGAEKTPRAIDKLARRLLAEREVRVTLRSLESTGCKYSYHAVDVRDREAFGALIDDIYERHGRLDAVLHGAGVIEDKLLQNKSLSSFARVFDTKVMGALTLAEKLRDDVRHVVFFSSVSSIFGNRGQTDYAAANDFLDKLAHHLNRKWSGHVLTINWGPWDSPGMVSPELRREYHRRGVALISPDEGVDCLLREMFSGQKDRAQVVWMGDGGGDEA